MRTKRLKLIPRKGGIYVDVYDYTVKEAQRKNEELVIEVGKEQMIVPPEHLGSGIYLTKQVFKSKFGGKDYKLISFRWKPQTEEEELKRYLI